MRRKSGAMRWNSYSADTSRNKKYIMNERSRKGKAVHSYVLAYSAVEMQHLSERESCREIDR